MILETVVIWMYKILTFMYGAVKTVIYAFGECIVDIIEAVVEILND